MCQADSFSRNSRLAMATPAVILIITTCLVKLLSSFRGDQTDIGDSAAQSLISRDVDDLQNIVDAEFYYKQKQQLLSKDAISGAVIREGGNEGTEGFYLYSMSYIPEFCRHSKFVNCSREYYEKFKGQLTIHGLWPSKFDGSSPELCTNEEFDTNLLSSLIEDLGRKWPNTKAPESSSPDHYSFWKHEWDTHGTCSGLSLHDYFGSALKILLPTPSIIENAYGSSLRRNDLIRDYKGFDGNAVIICHSGYLSQVDVCFEMRDGGEVGDRIKCPRSMFDRESFDKCDEIIKIASFGEAGEASNIAIE